jgi:hypothetical protein
MTRVLGVAAAVILTAAVGASAHGDAVKTTGTVKQINGQSVTIQPTAKSARPLTFIVAEWTEIDKAGDVAKLSDLKVGDRIVVEIPKGKKEAESIKIGPAAAAPADKPAEHKHKG